MKLRFIGGVLLVAGLPMLFSACKDDPKPKAAGIQFTEAEGSVTESDGTLASIHPQLISTSTGRKINITLTLDKPLADKAIVAYSISGTATKTGSKMGDFDIEGNDELLTIEKGQEEAVITVVLYEDFSLFSNQSGTITENEDEDDNGIYETIILTLDNVESGPISIGEQNEFTLKVYEDDTIVTLDWTATQADSVDMDLTVYLDGDVLTSSTNVTTKPEESGEGIYIPAGFPDDTYGLSYTYYSGKLNNLPFTVEITNLGGNLTFGPTTDNQLPFSGNYTLANINTYDNEDHPNYKGAPQVVQTMVKSGLNYTLSDINEAANTSRMRTGTLTNRLNLIKDQTFNVKNIKGIK